MKSFNKKLIVFGSNGFVARSLIRLLDNKDCDYVALGKKDLDLTNLEQSKKILRNMQFENVTIIFLSALRPSIGEEMDISIKNLEMIKNLILNININIIRQFIYISSDAVYPFTKIKITENTVVSPETLYGYMHSMREKYISNIITKEKLTVFRPCAIYGKDETSFNYGINQFIKTAIESKKIYVFGNGEEKRDHILVNDLVNIIYESFEGKITGLFNLASGESKSFKEVSTFVNNNFNNSIEIESKPRKKDINHIIFDTTKIQNKFKTDIKSVQDGIAYMIKSLK